MSVLTLPDGAVYRTADEPGSAAKAAWDGRTVAGIVVKSDAARRYTLTVGYPAYQPDAGVARDGHRDFASEAEVEKAAWDFMRNGALMGAYHQDGTEGAGECVESYIYRGPDWPIEARDRSTRVVKAGTWMIGAIWDEPTWDKFQKGELTGTSMQGVAQRRMPTPEDVRLMQERARG